MKESSLRKIDAFFESIAGWRKAYHSACLYYLAKYDDGRFNVVSARIFLDVSPGILIPEPYRAGSIQAGQWDICSSKMSVEQLIGGLLSPQGCQLDGHGVLRMAPGDGGEVVVSDPILLVPEMTAHSNRLVGLEITGGSREKFLSQPETDWILKGGELPYDNVEELCQDYGLEGMAQGKSRLEMIAQAPVQVFAGSTIIGTTASLGLWTAKSMDKYRLKLGYRILLNGKVIRRGMVPGEALEWTEAGIAMVGKVAIDVPEGARVQCISSYEDRAHHQQWVEDANAFNAGRPVVFPIGEIR
jgi:hypothetical protein